MSWNVLSPQFDLGGELHLPHGGELLRVGLAQFLGAALCIGSQFARIRAPRLAPPPALARRPQSLRGFTLLVA